MPCLRRRIRVLPGGCRDSCRILNFGSFCSVFLSIRRRKRAAQSILSGAVMQLYAGGSVGGASMLVEGKADVALNWSGEYLLCLVSSFTNNGDRTSGTSVVVFSVNNYIDYLLPVLPCWAFVQVACTMLRGLRPAASATSMTSYCASWSCLRLGCLRCCSLSLKLQALDSVSCPPPVSFLAGLWPCALCGY